VKAAWLKDLASASIQAAITAGLAEPEQADGMTAAKARDDLLDGVAHFEWHGHDIEVEVTDP
jgi:hypothetical protein